MRQNYSLSNLAGNCEWNKPIPIFIACFSPIMVDCLSIYSSFAQSLLYKLRYRKFQLSKAVPPRLSIIRSWTFSSLLLFTPDNRETIYRNLRNVQKWQVFAQWLTYVYVPLSYIRSKGTASAYITYCTGSGMLMRYMHW